MTGQSSYLTALSQSTPCARLLTSNLLTTQIVFILGCQHTSTVIIFKPPPPAPLPITRQRDIFFSGWRSHNNLSNLFVFFQMLTIFGRRIFQAGVVSGIAAANFCYLQSESNFLNNNNSVDICKATNFFSVMVHLLFCSAYLCCHF